MTPRWVMKARSAAPERQMQTPVVVVVAVVVVVVVVVDADGNVCGGGGGVVLVVFGFVCVASVEEEEEEEEEQEAVETRTSCPCAASAILLRIKEPKKSLPRAVCRAMFGVAFDEDDRSGKRRRRLASCKTELQALPPGVKAIGASVSTSVPHSGRWVMPPTTTSQKASPTIEI